MTAPAPLGDAELAAISKAILASDTCTEVCKQRRGCGKVVRYWNNSGTGNASCDCCGEGPEACDPIPLPDGVVGADLPRLLATIAARAERVRVLEAGLREALAGWEDTAAMPVDEPIARLRALLPTEGVKP